MKRLKAFLILFTFVSTVLKAQNTGDNSPQVVTVSAAQNFYLDSRIVSNINGRSRLTIPVNLPEGTVKWFYSFAAVESKNEPLEWVGLAGQLTKLYDRTGIASEVINRLVKPTGTSSCDIYVLNTEGISTFLNKTDENFSYDKENSRLNFTGGVVEVPFKTSNIVLGLSNPSVKSGINLKVEVTALVVKVVKKDFAKNQATWTKEAKANIYTQMTYLFDGKKSAAADAIMLCAMDSVSKMYALEEYNQLLNNEKNSKLTSIVQECFSKTGNQNLGIEMGEIANLKSRRDAAEQSGNFNEMLKLSQKIEDMGYSSQPNRIKLMRANLLTGQYDNALSMADLMHRLTPSDWTINLHLAHAYLFKNQYDKAEKQYLKYKNQVNTEGVRWEQIVSDDFNFFIKNKVFNSRYTDIKKKLKIE